MKRWGVILVVLIPLLVVACGGGGGGDSSLPRITRVTINGFDAQDQIYTVCIGSDYNIEIYLENETQDVSGIYWDEKYPDGSTVTTWIPFQDWWNYYQVLLTPTPPVGRYEETLRLQSLNGHTSYTFYSDMIYCAASQSTQLNDLPRWDFENAIGDYLEMY